LAISPFKLLQPLFGAIWGGFLKILGRGDSIDNNLSPERIDVIVVGVAYRR
jgi:hypothetical protein